MNDHRRASALETRLDLKLVRCEKETRFEGCELKKEREMRGEKDRHEAFQEEELQQETRPVGACFIKCYPSSRS